VAGKGHSRKEGVKKVSEPAIIGIETARGKGRRMGGEKEKERGNPTSLQRFIIEGAGGVRGSRLYGEKRTG